MPLQALFSNDGERALAVVMHLEPLLAFDFDGTLAPIVARPDDAGVEPEVARRLGALAARLPVAVITGRSVDDVRPRLGFAPRFVIGNHGVEDPLLPEPLAARLALEPLRERLRAEAPALRAAGIDVEDKRYSLALHYRRAADPVRARAVIDGLCATLDAGLAAFGGKCVLNVTVADAPDKGRALASLLERTGARVCLFIGDDVNDEPVFRTLRPPSLGLRVGDDPQSQAMFFIEEGELPRLLARMQALTASAPGN